MPDAPTGLNRGHTIRATLDGRVRGLTLLEHLLARFQHADAPTWLARIARGEVSLDGRRPEPGDALHPGQVLEWHRPPWHEPPAPLHYEVLVEDAHVLAVAKPAGLPTNPGAGFMEHTLLHLVRAHAPGASPMHRLGRGTSGVVLFAKTPAAASSIQAQWREPGTVVKVYRALVAGAPSVEDLVVDTPIGRVPDPVVGELYCATPGGKPSRSRLRLLEQREGAALLEVHIQTGRPHQIRIHAAAAGHPLVGDPLYGPGGVRAPGSIARPGDVGYSLHAHRLGLRHPASGAPLEVEAPPPPVLSTKRPGAL